jgi:hypothetical protein
MSRNVKVLCFLGQVNGKAVPAWNALYVATLQNASSALEQV